MRVLLGLRVGRLFALVEERRQRDSGQDSEDEHDDEELDQREDGLAVAVEPGANLRPEILDKHQAPPRFLIVEPDPRRISATWCLSTPVVARPTPKRESRQLCAPASQRVCLWHRSTGRFITPL